MGTLYFLKIDNLFWAQDFENLDMTLETQEIVKNEVNLIINSAASIDFMAPLDYALQINVLGPLKVLELAKKMKNLSIFVNISTCYVNANKPGYTEEKRVEIYEDPEKTLEGFLQMGQAILRRDSQKIMKGFPNSYTFSKNLSEQVLYQKKGSVPLFIFRPSIISCSIREPYMGWVDRLSASGAVFLLGGLGILHTLQGKYENIGDNIPVDMCVNQLLVASAYFACKGGFNVMHSATSNLNPMFWSNALESVINYYKLNPPEKALEYCQLNLTSNKNLIKIRELKRRIPGLAYYQLSVILRNSSMKKQATKYLKVLERAKSTANIFNPFTINEWIFETKVVGQLLGCISEEEADIFCMDVKKIEWNSYLIRFGWGLRKYVLKEDVRPLEEELKSMDLNKSLRHNDFFSDIVWAAQFPSKYLPFPQKRAAHWAILNSPRVKEAIEQTLRTMKPNIKEKGDPRKMVEKKAKKIMKLMTTKVNPTMIKTCIWILKKYFVRAYEKVIINESSLKEIKKFQFKTHGPVVFLPTHRSYIDFLVIPYILMICGIRIPNIGFSEEFLNLFVITGTLRACGSFFMFNEPPQYRQLYSAIFSEFLSGLLADGNNLEFFIETNRSRTNKILQPNFTILEAITECIVDGKIPDAVLIPCTINYEKVMEGDTFPLELLGENKVGESLFRVITGLRSLFKSNGRVYIEFSEPRSYKALMTQNRNVEHFTKFFSEKGNREKVTKEIAMHVVYELEKNLVITPTAMIAGIILMNRKGILEEELVEKVDWLSTQLQLKGIKIAGSGSSKLASGATVRNCLNLLKEFLREKKDILEPTLKPEPEYKNFLMLSYYRYPLVSIFFKEAIIASALLSFGNALSLKEGVPYERVLDEADYLFRLLNEEKPTILKNKDSELFQAEVNATIDTLINRRYILKIQDNKLIVGNDADASFALSFFASLLVSIIETYWVSLVVINKIKIKENIPERKLISQIQWYAESMFEERVMEHYESCSLEIIRNTLLHFDETGLLNIQENVNPKTGQLDHIIKILKSEQSILNQIDHVSKFVKQPYGRSYKSPIETIPSVFIVEKPML